MTLTFKEKELVIIGVSVATGCKPCTDYHFTVTLPTNLQPEPKAPADGAGGHRCDALENIGCAVDTEADA